MKNLQLITGLNDIINNLLEAGITPCTAHEARCYMDCLFDKYEESDGIDFDFEVAETVEKHTPFNSTEFFNSLASSGMFGILFESECD